MDELSALQAQDCVTSPMEPQITTETEAEAIAEMKDLDSTGVRSDSERSRKGVPLKDNNLVTHYPKHPDCEICDKAKIQKAHGRRKSWRESPKEDSPLPLRRNSQIGLPWTT